VLALTCAADYSGKPMLTQACAKPDVGAAIAIGRTLSIEPLGSACLRDPRLFIIPPLVR
jgi:hypothetical protein